METKIQLIISIITLLGIFYAIYMSLRNPDISNEKEIALIKQSCGLKHVNLNENILSINKTLNLIQENDLKHIEGEIRSLKENQIKIFTILDERLPKK